MANKELPKPNKKDQERQEKINKKLEKEKIQLDHPQGLERFQRVIKRISKKTK